MANLYGDQHAHIMQIADSMQIFNGPPERDHVADGRNSLAASRHEQARRCFDNALVDDPDNAVAHYYLVLALLGQVRPREHMRAALEKIDVHLGHAGELPQAQVLAALVNEDRDRNRTPKGAVPEWLSKRIGQMNPQQVEEIVKLVPAPGSDVWQALRSRLES